MRWYRAALRLLPRQIQRRHGDQMAAVFAEQLADARRAGGRRAVLRTIVLELRALLQFAWREQRAAATSPRIDERALAAETRSQTMIADARQDVRNAARMMWRSPGFSLVVIATLALAIGANTAIFSVVNGILLRALPYADPETVVVIGHRTGGNEALSSTTPGNLYDFFARATAFSAMAGYATTERTLTVNGNAERVLGGMSVGNIFAVLGREPLEGRTLTAQDDEPGAAPVMVLSASLARRLFGTASAVGQSVSVGPLVTTIVGVMPADFAFVDFDAQYWIPARFEAAFRSNRDQYFLLGLARLAPGVDIRQAETQLNTVMDAIRRDHPLYTQNAVATVQPIKDVLLDGNETRLVVLMATVGFVLLVACANLGNLLLARAAARRQEMALRQALGAGRRRLVRQTLVESLWLAACGGIAGLAVGAGLLAILMRHLPATLPRLQGVSLDDRVLVFTAGVSLLTGLLVGALPAFQFASAPMTTLRSGTRTSPRTARVRSALVASQVGLSLMLLAGAGLLARSFAALSDVSPGFRTDALLTFSATVPGAVYQTGAERLAFFEQAAAAIEALPGVRAVTLTTQLPVAGRGAGAWFNVVDRPLPPDQTPPGIPNRVVRANYFSTLGIPLLAGRDFTAADGAAGARAVIISEAVARRFFPDRSPLGQRIYMGAPDNRVIPESEVVGVVANVKQTGLDEAAPEAVYAPHAMLPQIAGFTFAVRTAHDAASLAPAIRAVMQRLDPSVPIVRLHTMDEIVGRATAPARSSMLLVSLFAVVALTLSLVGVFGVLSYTVSQQVTELGIRIALGASAAGVAWLVVRDGLRPVITGLILGVAGALALSRLMASLLFNVSPSDPVTLATVSAAVLATAAGAALIPAWRAARVDPVRVLRQA